jgi:hypothetical protein
VQEALDGLAEWPFHCADALMFFPYVRAPDRLTGRDELFPPSAAAVGALLRETGIAVWREPDEPALLRPGTTPSVWVDRLQRARLAQLGVNTLHATRSPAPDVIPGCTLAGELGNGADARLLSGRRFALHLAASIERGTRWVVLEGNTPRSRERASRQVARFLAHHAAEGAFGDTGSHRPWFVLCDDRLNGPVQVGAGVFRMIWGFQSAHGTNRQSWLVEHKPGGSHTRAVSLNQFALLG